MDSIALLTRMVADELSREAIPLPIPDGIAGTLSDLLSKENVSIDDISRVIARDSSLTAKVLNVSNSPYYSGLAKIRSIDQAIMRVGLNAVKSLIMTVVLKDVFRIEKDYLQDEFCLNWRHSLACGLCARRIAEQSHFSFAAEDAYLLGLLHDIGVVLLLNLMCRMHRENDAFEVNADTFKTALDRLHAPAGAVLLKKMNFNEMFCTIVELHHTPELYPNQQDSLFNVLQVAEALARKSGVAFNPDADLRSADMPGAVLLKLDEQFLGETAASVHGMLAEVECIL
jgi:HD-like signal output (HDOD) protein